MNTAAANASGHHAATEYGPRAPSRARSMPGVHHIELNLQAIEQLFNTMDPSPFHEKDLDHDAEEFIVSWAQEYHRHEPVDLIIYLEKWPDSHHPVHLVSDAVHNYFEYRARLNQLEFKRLMKQGRMSLLMGVSFLLACLGAIELLPLKLTGTFAKFFSEGLTIAGWARCGSRWRFISTTGGPCAGEDKFSKRSTQCPWR